MVVNTGDSFLGREGYVVIFTTVVTVKTGPLFVADPHRICVATSRHIGTLFVVGINTPRDIAACEGEAGSVKNDLGQTVSVKKTAFPALCRYFIDNNGRVAYHAPPG